MNDETIKDEIKLSHDGICIKFFFTFKDLENKEFLLNYFHEKFKKILYDY